MVNLLRMGKDKKEVQKYSIAELAAKYKVSPRTVSGWIWGNKFPNAEKITPPVGVAYWLVPETDLKDFIKPSGRGRPRSENPSDDALRKRDQRENKK